MLWIKRNMFLALGGVVAVGLLGYFVYFFLGARSKNAELEEEINQTVNTLKNFYEAPVFPGPSNITVAKAETVRLRRDLEQMQRFFVAVPAMSGSSLAFRSYRDNTLAELHRMADQARTGLPSRAYAFSFEAQKTKVDFQAGTFPAIPQQMAEVKTLCRILFDAHVDPLLNIRRARVSLDDAQSNAATDYLLSGVETNFAAETVTSPYEVSFHCLSADLAAVMQGFLQSTNGFVVKAIHVEPAVEAAAAPATGPGPGGALTPQIRRGTPPVQPPVQRPVAPGVQPTRPAPGAAPVPGAAPPAAGFLPPPAAATPATRAPAAGGEKPIVLLKERRLKVTLLIHAIRALK